MNTPNVTIEMIREESISGFHQAVDLVAREKKYLARNEAPPIEDAQTFAKDNIQKGNAHYVATASGKVVGWCDIVPLKKEVFSHCGVLGMGVIEEYRGQGIGRKLMEAALKQSKAKWTRKSGIGGLSHKQQGYRTL